jgi:hypothetical protein
LEGVLAPSCSEDGGNFNYTYGNNENITWTFCPDDPGDGVTFMTFSFISGQMEAGFETLTIYDGEDTSAPVLAVWNTGDATGQSWTATNSNGCLTIGFTSDGIFSASDGWYDPWNYSVTCSDAASQYVWEWTPADGLNNPNIPSPTISTMDGTTLYTLVGYPIGHPACGSSDEVLVTVPTGLELVLPFEPRACPGEITDLSPVSIEQGVEPYTFNWEDNNNVLFDTETINVPVEEAKEYCLTVTDACGTQVTECTTLIPYETIAAAFELDTNLGCEPLVVQFEALTQNTNQVANMQWYFEDGDEGSSLPSISHQYLEGVYQPYMVLETIDGCFFSDTLDNPLIVFPQPLSTFSHEPEVAILPSTSFSFLNNSIDADYYYWGFDLYGNSTEYEPSFTFPEEQNGQYLVHLIASNQYGCVDSSSTYLLVMDEIVIYAPNGIHTGW